MNRVVRSAVGVVAAALCFATVWPDLAFADRRVALVVGNSDYQNAPVLPNPIRDAEAMATKLREGGFAVVSAHNDLGNLSFKRAIRQFEDAATAADIVVVFYAGHGVELRGVNFVIPVDAKLASDRDAEDEAITLDRLLQSVEGARRLGLVILDACRDNPFARNMKRSRTTALRAVSLGLSAVEPSTSNTLIAYAARAGTSAEDGLGDHSPFTTALINHLFVEGLDVRLAFGRVRDEVMKATRGRQEPFVYGSIGGENISLIPAPAQATIAVDPQGERADYELVEKIGTKRAWEVFLTQHPKGFYAELARQQIDKLAALEPAKPAPAPITSSEERRVWDRIKDGSNAAQLRDFIKQYPSSPLANTAQKRLDALEQEGREREERARLDREAKAAEAAREQAERARIAAEAERQKAEREAAAKRAEEERIEKLAQMARAKQEEELRRQAERENKARTQREAKAAEAAQQLAEREAKAEAKRQKAEREAAAKRAEEERIEKLAQTARAKEEEARHLAEQEAKAAEAKRQKAEREAAAERPAGVIESTKPASNTPELVRLAQKELARIGCFTGDLDGMLGVATRAAVKRYRHERGQAAAEIEVTGRLVSELMDESSRVCSLVCPSGKSPEGDQCVAIAPLTPPARRKGEGVDKSPGGQKARQEPNSKAIARQKDIEDRGARAKKQEPQQRARQDEARPQLRVRQEAKSSAPRVSGGGGGGHGPTIGVGF